MSARGTQLPDASPEVEAELRAALQELVSRFEFEQGAVLVNIPQVPFDLLDGEVA